MTKLRLGMAAGAAAVMAFGIAACGENISTDTREARMASLSVTEINPTGNLICVEGYSGGETFYLNIRDVARPDHYITLTRESGNYYVGSLREVERSWVDSVITAKLREGADRAQAQETYDALMALIASTQEDYNCAPLADGRPSSQAWESSQAALTEAQAEISNPQP
ncbi:MAG: hypothetical protein GC136_09970 [Alphaproteobacteria bacterium]|nr:hypothetical protein [Alphaproteobacteria bacterium]